MKLKGLLIIIAVAEVVLGASSVSSGAEGPGKQIIFLYSPGHHPNKAGCELLKYCLENSSDVKGIRCRLYNSWPDDPGILEEAATIVIYSEGINEQMKKQGRPHPVFSSQERLEYLDKLMKEGVGMVCIHYSLYASRQLEGPKLLDWIGGYYDFEGYGSAHWITRKSQVFKPVTAYHLVSRGWGEFALKENEFYHNLRFAEVNCPVPILRTTFTDRKTNQARQHIVAWALERKDGGRGFGFGGGHFYSVWLNDDCRKVMLNAILWSSKMEVPEAGVWSRVPGHWTRDKAGRH